MSLMVPAGSLCTKRFSYQDQKLQRLCVGDNCQCMAGIKTHPLGKQTFETLFKLPFKGCFSPSGMKRSNGR